MSDPLVGVRPELREALVEFERWHRDARNRRCHDLGIPLVTLPVLGLLSRVRLGVALPVVGELDLALVLLAGTFLLDLGLWWRVAPVVAGTGLALWALARPLPGWALGAIFVIGWAFQLAGHRVFEKNAPAFTTNAIHAFIGPRWLALRWLGVSGRRPGGGGG